jgi:hypothetical protein
MPKKLYEVEIVAYVMAENEEDARYINIDTGSCDIDVNEADEVPEHWLDALPFNSDDDKTISQILAEKNTEEKTT